MKRKRSAALSLAGPRWDAAMAAVFSVLLFFAMHVSAEPFSVGMAFIALALCVGRTPWRLARERFCVPVVGFLVFIVLYGIPLWRHCGSGVQLDSSGLCHLGFSAVSGGAAPCSGIAVGVCGGVRNCKPALYQLLL